MKKLNSYLCYNNYFATGEGNHVWLSLEYAPNKKFAKTQFQERFKISDYFMIGADVYQTTNNKKIKKILDIHFHEGMTAYFLEVIKHNAGDFEFNFDANFS